MTKRTPALVRAQERYDAKTIKLNLRLHPDEKTRLEALAIKAGTSPTGLIRHWIESEG